MFPLFDKKKTNSERLVRAQSKGKLSDFWVSTFSRVTGCGFDTFALFHSACKSARLYTQLSGNITVAKNLPPKLSSHSKPKV